MTVSPRPAVFDCNVLLQTMLSSRGPSHACWQKAATGEVHLFVTPYMLAEVRRLPSHKKLRRFVKFTPERIERFIEELLDVAELIADPPPVFSYPRDPKDAHYVDVAIATGAMLVVSNDKDLLCLVDGANVAGQTLRTNHPTLRILTPPQFLVTIDSSLT